MSSSPRPCTPTSVLCTPQAQLYRFQTGLPPSPRPCIRRHLGPALPSISDLPVPKSGAPHPQSRPRTPSLPPALSGLASPSGLSATPQPGPASLLQRQARTGQSAFSQPSCCTLRTRVGDTRCPYNTQCSSVRSRILPSPLPELQAPPPSKPGPVCLASHPSSQWLCTPHAAPGRAPQIR